MTVGLSRLIEQYRNKPRIVMWILCYLQQVQYLEDAIHATVEAWDIDNATGWRLETIGALVGQQRIGSTDAVYRVFIKARIRANRSLGKYEDLAAVANILIGSGNWTYNARRKTVEILANLIAQGFDAEALTAVQAMLQIAAPAGTRVCLTSHDDRDDAHPTFAPRSRTTAIDGPRGYASRSIGTLYIPGNYAKNRG